jgi:hypothetical protein
MLKEKRPTYEREDLGLSEPASVAEIVLYLCADLARDQHVVVGDRWFGNFSVAEELKRNGIDCVLKCMNNRPKELWDQVHHLPANKYGIKQASAVSESNHKIYCFSKVNTDSQKFNQDKTNLADQRESHENILSTVQFTNYVERTLLSVNSEGERTEETATLHEIFDFYNHASSFVDEANRSLMSCFYGHRIYHYQTSLLVFLLCLIAHNARILFNVKSGSQLSQIQFMKDLSNELWVVEDHLECHEMREINHNRYANCAVCYWRKRQAGTSSRACIRAKTKFGCTVCKKPMCKNCFESFDHSRFALSMK